MRAIFAGGGHALALLSDGTVRAWGGNLNGQLGNASRVNSNLRVTVAGLAGATAVTAGVAHSLAIRADQTVWAWGLNATGQLGNAATTDRWR